jgi:enediyne biosynthesis protein E4
MYVSHKILLSLMVAGLVSCSQKKTLFESLPSSQTGIDFINKVEENDKYNVLDYMNIYTGAGVAAGDVNNDGLVDLYFSGNENSGKLYINKGNFKFEDVTEKAGLITNRWCTGVSMVDINQDGWLDIYVNVAGSPKFGNTANLLYINKGLSPSPSGEGRGEVTFTEKAAKYGIADTRLTMNASFFDYDKDGDLDLFLITNPADERVNDVNTITEIQQHGESPGTDILYRNNGPSPSASGEDRGEVTFTDVSKEAGILKEGYSLGAAISDVNNDGWPDIYVSNDFLTGDILYINNGNGTFSDKTHECLKHTSFASMGNDVADFNNDGLPDIYTLDMLPEDNYRKKMIIPAAGYDKFQLLLQKGYEPQYTRNALQLNNGSSLSPDKLKNPFPFSKGEGAQRADEVEGRGEVTFSDIAFLSNVSSTDWSWASLFADYDNDGDKDLMVTNGFYRDLGDQDYIHYQAKLNNPMGSQSAKRAEKLKAVKALANIPLQDYLFENNNDLTFTKRSTDWGFNEPGFSNGACYADLDNDGDLELIINQFNSKAKIFKNNANELLKNNYLSIKLKSKQPNTDAIGSKVYVFTKGQMQMQELNPYRGYESSMEPVLHFGIGKNTAADSIKIIWPDGAQQKEITVKANQVVNIAYAPTNSIGDTVMKNNSPYLFTNITGKNGLNYHHTENEFADFKIQPLLPHMHSKNGPGIATGDINGDGKEDFYIGAASGNEGSFFIQNSNGTFFEKKLKKDTLYEDMGVLLFDADNDNDLDLYVVSGGSENTEGTTMQQDRLYLNDGKGSFAYKPDALPETKASGSCVVACDYDKDGDLDLFIGGRVLTGSYPLAAKSYLLKNDALFPSPKGEGRGEVKFSDVSATELPQQGKIGMVTAALWTDYDNDGWIDLMLAGEFMPITFIKNEKGKLAINSPTIIDHSQGWWNSIAAADFDEDGDIDYIIGNLGLNTRHKASAKEPLCVYAKDFDKNGRLDPVMCYYVDGKNYIYPTRDEMIKQVAAMRGRFQSYKDFASVTFEESFTKQELSDALVVKSECFESSYLENKGNGKFERKALPLECQFAPIFGMLTGDYNNDGYTDVLITGNSYSTEVSTGAYDAMTGILLTGNGKGNFKTSLSSTTGFKADGDSKGIAALPISANTAIILSANNDGDLKTYAFATNNITSVAAGKNDAYAVIQKKDGKAYRQEFYWGNSYLSNSSRVFSYNSSLVSTVIFYDNKGNKKQIITNSK